MTSGQKVENLSTQTQALAEAKACIPPHVLDRAVRAGQRVRTYIEKNGHFKSFHPKLILSSNWFKFENIDRLKDRNQFAAAQADMKLVRLQPRISDAVRNLLETGETSLRKESHQEPYLLSTKGRQTIKPLFAGTAGTSSSHPYTRSFTSLDVRARRQGPKGTLLSPATSSTQRLLTQPSSTR